MMGIKKQLFTCKRDGLLIRGVQYLPAELQEGKRYPAVIISYGYTETFTEVVDFCRDFAQMGYMAFCITVLTEVADLLIVKEYVKKLPYTDNSNLVLVGFNQGGLTSGLAAAKCGNEISKLIMVFPVLGIPEHTKRGCIGGANTNAENVPVEPYMELSAYKGPVLILQGLEDNLIDYSNGILLQANYEKEQCHLQMIRHMRQGFDAEMKKSIVASMRQFLAEREEILTIRVIITRCESMVIGEVKRNDVYFTGYCDTGYFRGAIVPEGCDKQEFVEGKCPKIRAEYTLLGNDCNGDNCSIHIVNQWDKDEWRPVITTQSKALAWLNDADLTAVLEFGKGELTVRVFAPIENR